MSNKITYIAKHLRAALQDQMTVGNAKNLYEAVEDSERSKNSFAISLAKIAFAVPGAGQTTMAARHVGSFKGKVTSNFLKPIGQTTAGVVNPRLSLKSSMTKNLRTDL